MGLKDKAHRLVSILGGLLGIHLSKNLTTNPHLAAGWLVERSDQIEQAAFA